MFKRILSAITGKKLGPIQGSSAPPVQLEESQLSSNELITAYDTYGREVKITRSEWLDKIFMPNLQQKWNDADALYNQIVTGLTDGFAANLQPAAKRLIEIDSNFERSHTIQGIVLMKNGQLEAAKATFCAGIVKVGETGTLLSNLAKVLSATGDQAGADETLWRAIQTDPNQENGLLWWVAIQKERDGESGYLQALRKAASLPESWRAKLWLARHHLEHKEVALACALYKDVLDGGLFDGSALMMISGDLGNNGQVSLILELIAPVFDEQKHDFATGLNLLRAYQQLKNIDQGEVLLARMYGLGISPIKRHLDEFAQAFQEMRKQITRGIPIDADSLKISTIVLNQPIWHYGLRNADWLFTQKEKGASEVGFFVLSKIKDGTERAESQREDDIGRFSRAIPLYFAEAAHYWSDYISQSYFLIAEGGGPVLPGGETDANTIFDIVPASMKYFVTGEIGCMGAGDDAQWHISLNLWDCRSRVKKASERGQASQLELGALVLTLEQRLSSHIGLKRERPLDTFYQSPTAEVMPVYLNELGQAFMLTLLANAHMQKSAIWGERAMLDWPLTMALHWPTVETPKLMYISGLGKALDYQSDVLAEYKERSLQMLRDANQGNSPAARLAPIVWKAFGMTKELQAHIEDQSTDTNQAYKKWLERVVAQ